MRSSSPSRRRATPRPRATSPAPWPPSNPNADRRWSRMTSEPSFDVLVCGSLHLDIVVHAPHLPRTDETVVGEAWDQVCGGKGGNQAVQAARLGARTAMI